MTQTTAEPAVYSQFQGQISALHRALMRRIQEVNGCRSTGVDCNVRGGGMLCSCSLEAQNEIEVEAWTEASELPVTADPWDKPMNEWSIGDVEKALEAETTDRWTEGVCGYGAAILYDGVSVSISCVLEALNDRDNLRGVLAEISDARTDSCLVHELVQQALGFDPDLDALEDAESHG